MLNFTLSHSLYQLWAHTFSMRAARDCHQCGKTLRRVQRTLLEKILFGSAYQCHDCGSRVYDPNLLLIDFRKYASCPSCGTAKITPRSSTDPIEKVYRSPFSFFRRKFGAKLYRCQYCRLQFHDFRELREPVIKQQSIQIQARG
jgi:DNA-directed RNA polymerase subunit RPC12/RpoP